MLHPYRVKEILWAIIIVLYIMIALVGCGSNPKVANNNGHQYCFNNKKITVKDGTEVTSESVTTCSDDVVGKLVDVKAGLAKECGYVNVYMQKGPNNYVPRTAIVCKDPNGDSSVLISTVTR